MLKGRQIAFLIRNYLKLTEAEGAVQQFRDLNTVYLQNDDLWGCSQKGPTTTVLYGVIIAYATFT